MEFMKTQRISSLRTVCLKVLLFGLKLSFAALIPALCSSTPLRAQDTTPHAPTITVSARLVVLDVVVTGPNGKPVDGLTQEDFRTNCNQSALSSRHPRILSPL